LLPLPAPGTKMRYKKIYKIVKEVDKDLNRNQIMRLLSKFNPKFIGRGAYKRAFLIKANKKILVLKVGRDIKIQYEVYNNLKRSKLKYAKIYWITDRFMIQKYCNPIKKIDSLEFSMNKRLAKKKGYSDYRKANIGTINDKMVVFDLQRRK
jgi:hypothetical protein